jgi:hypothetical protein
MTRKAFDLITVSSPLGKAKSWGRKKDILFEMTL